MLFDALMCMPHSKSNKGRVMDWDLDKMDEESIQKLRRQIGFIDPDMHLDKDLNVARNFKMYAEALGLNYSESLSLLDRYLYHFGLSSGVKVSDLDQLSLYITRYVICLAKRPQLILSEDLPLMVDKELLDKSLQKIYQLAFSEGITFVSAVSDESLTRFMPGRYVELT